LDMKLHYVLEEIPYLKQSLLKNYMVEIPNIQENHYMLEMDFKLDQNCFISLDKAVIIPIENKIVQETERAQVMSKVATMKINDLPKGDKKNEEEHNSEKVKKVKIINCVIKQIACSYGHDSSTMTNMIQREANQEKEDMIIKYTKDKRNELESFIYTTKEKLKNELMPYTDKNENESVMKILEDTETWLYNNHEETYNKNTIEDIYNKSTLAANKIYKRKEDWEEYEHSLNLLKNSIESNISRYNSQFKLSKDNKSKLIKKDFDEVSKLIRHYNDVYTKTFEKTKNIPKYTDCPINIKNSGLTKIVSEFEEKINIIFVDAEKRKMEEDKRYRDYNNKNDSQYHVNNDKADSHFNSNSKRRMNPKNPFWI